jgi:hypothetical protein
MMAIHLVEMVAVLIARQLRLAMNVQFGVNLVVKFVEMES